MGYDSAQRRVDVDRQTLEEILELTHDDRLAVELDAVEEDVGDPRTVDAVDARVLRADRESH